LIGAWGLVFWVLLYAGGFSYVAGLSYIQSLPQNAKSIPGRLTLSQERKESKPIGGKICNTAVGLGDGKRLKQGNLLEH
jgi:hypothetical protein